MIFNGVRFVWGSVKTATVGCPTGCNADYSDLWKLFVPGAGRVLVSKMAAMLLNAWPMLSRGGPANCICNCCTFQMTEDEHVLRLKTNRIREISAWTLCQSRFYIFTLGRLRIACSSSSYIWGLPLITF